MVSVKDIYDLAKAVYELNFIVDNDEYLKTDSDYLKYKKKVLDGLDSLKVDEVITVYQNYKALENTLGQ